MDLRLDHAVALTEDVAGTVERLTATGATPAWPLTSGRGIETAGLWIGSVLVDVTRLDGANNATRFAGVMLRPSRSIWEACDILARANQPHTPPIEVKEPIEGLNWSTALLGQLLDDEPHTLWLTSWGGKSIPARAMAAAASILPFKQLNGLLTGSFAGLVTYSGDLAPQFDVEPPTKKINARLEIKVRPEHRLNWARLGDLPHISLVEGTRSEVVGVRLHDGELVAI